MILAVLRIVGSGGDFYTSDCIDCNGFAMSLHVMLLLKLHCGNGTKLYYVIFQFVPQREHSSC
jgi:hypothetical protein